MKERKGKRGRGLERKEGGDGEEEGRQGQKETQLPSAGSLPKCTLVHAG